MRLRSFFGFLMMIVTTGLLAQGGFQRTYDTAVGDTIYNPQDATTSVGEVISIGFRQFEKDRQALIVTTLDMKGNVKWQQQLDMGRDTVVLGEYASIAVDSDGDSLLFSFSAEINGEAKELFGRSTKNGLGFYAKSIDGAFGSPNYTSKVASFVNGTDLIVRSGDRPTVARVGSGDALLWSQRFRINDDTGAERQSGISSITGTPDSTILLCDRGGLQEVIVAELDSNGTQIWAESYTFSGISVQDIFAEDAINLADRTHAVVGHYASLPMDTQGFVMILDTLGDVLVAHEVVIGDRPTKVKNVIQQMDGSLWIAGTYTEGDSLQYFTSSMTIDGIVNWTTIYPSTVVLDDDFGTALLPVEATGGAVLVGKAIDDSGRPQLNVMSHGPMGETACSLIDTATLVVLNASADTMIFTSENGGLFFTEFEMQQTMSSLLAPPVLNIREPYIFCPNEVIDTFLIAEVGGVDSISYQWGNENGIIQGETNDSLQIMKEGQYSVTVTIGEDVCYTMCDTVEVTRSTPPMVSVQGTLCDTRLTANVAQGKPPFEFMWSTGDTLGDIDSPDMATYTVTVTDQCGDTGTASYTTKEFNLVVEWDQDNKALCEEEGVKLQAGVQGGGPNPVYTWSDGQEGKVIIVTEEGEYTVTATDNCGLVATYTDDVVFPDRPTSAEITFEVNCAEDSNESSGVIFTATSNNGMEVLLEIDSLVNGSPPVKVTNPNSQLALGVYQVVVKDPLCNNEIASETIDVSALCGVFRYPRIFFPGGGGAEQEDVFGPIPPDTMSLDRITDFEFKIFNRWGETVYESTEVLEPWDGTHNGNPAPSEVYIWYATYRVDGVLITEPDKGDITLVR